MWSKQSVKGTFGSFSSCYCHQGPRMRFERGSLARKVVSGGVRICLEPLPKKANPFVLPGGIQLPGGVLSTAVQRAPADEAWSARGSGAASIERRALVRVAVVCSAREACGVRRSGRSLLLLRREYFVSILTRPKG